MCPALVDSKEIKEVFLSDSNVKKVVEYGYKSDTILITMEHMGFRMQFIVRDILVMKKCKH